MENNLIIKNINITGNKIEVNYDVEGKWKEYLNHSIKFFSSYDQSVEKVPYSIAVIPFLCNIIPISWVHDLSIIVDELDENFYNCLENIKYGYKNMYPKLNFKGNLLVKKIIKNKYTNNNSSVLFSGGVDAFCTLLRHLDEKPDIVTVIGADILLDDTKGIKNVNKQHEIVSEKFNLNYKVIYSNLKEIINYNSLSSYVSKKVNCEWWHDFQHGIALIGLVSPLAYINHYGITYIASSFCETQKGTYTCASDPTIDNMLKYGSTNTIHDGYELDRQQKIELICNEKRKRNIDKLNLRVCWETSGGINCCECEKCYRTIMGIITEKDNTNDYYFNFNNEKRKKMISFLSKNLVYNTKNGNIVNYQPIQNKFLTNYTFEETPDDLKWFRKIKIGSRNSKIYYIKLNLKRKIKSFIN